MKLSALLPQGRKLIRRAGSQAAESRGARLFARNTVASFFAFGIDIALLWIFVEQVGISYLPAAAVAFLIAMSVHYVLSRIWVFRGTDRGVVTGYLYFLINAGVGLVVTLTVFWVLIQFTELYYLVSRVIASVAAGFMVFFLNAIFNFKQL